MNRVRLVREGKLFRAWDLLVYGLLALLIAFLFVLFVCSDVFGTGDARGFRVEVRGEAVYTYVFGEGGSAAEGKGNLVEERTEGETLYVRILSADGWNELAVDLAEESVRMHDADCSLRKDCTHMRAIGAGGRVITCLPHALKVVPLGGEDLSSPSVG